ncbi:hypothetical protein JCM10450v2_005377 [Rhodotorula kratochvilovae]
MTLRRSKLPSPSRQASSHFSHPLLPQPPTPDSRLSPAPAIIAPPARRLSVASTLSPISPLTDPAQAASSTPRQFTLVSSDGQSFPVDAIKLPATCTLSEDKDDIALFVKTLETWESPTWQDQWLALYKMADKYDCACFAPVLGKAAWKMLPKDSIFAYAASIYLKDEDLMKAFAKESLARSVPDLSPSPGRNPLYFSLPSAARVSLEHYYLMHKHVAERTLNDVYVEPDCDCDGDVEDDPDAYACSARKCWEESRAAVLTQLGADTSMINLMCDDIYTRRQRWDYRA